MYVSVFEVSILGLNNMLWFINYVIPKGNGHARNLTLTRIVENVSIGTTRIIITNSNARTVTVGKFGLQKRSFEKNKVRRK